MKKIYYVDLPDPSIGREGDNCYINVATFDTKKNARAWLLNVHGMPQKIADFFITEGSKE